MSTLTALISGGSPTQEGGIPVNSVQRFELNGQTLYTDEYNQQWLKSGSVIFPSSPSEYPYATRTAASFSLSTNSGEASNLFGQSVGTAFAFSSDGTKLYLIENDYGRPPYATNSQRSIRVHQYSLSTPFDITTKTPDNKILDTYGVTPAYTSDGSAISRGMAFAGGGTKLYIFNQGDQTAYQYTLATAWDVSTASYDNKSIALNGTNTNPYGLYVKEDGTRLYSIGGTADQILMQYNLSTAYDISTAVFSTSRSISAQWSSVWYALTFSNDGTKCYAFAANGNIYQYNLSTAWAINTATYSNNLYAINGQYLLRDLFINADGTSIYTISTRGQLNKFNLSTAYNISTAAPSNFVYYSYDATFFQTGGTYMSSDGVNLYKSYTTAGNTGFATGNGAIFRFILSTPYDVLSATYHSVGYVNQVGTSIFSITADGTKLYAADQNGTIIYQFTLTTAWDITTITYDNIQTTITTGNPAANGITAIFMSPDGVYLWLGSGGNLAGNTYILSTPYSVATATLSTTFGLRVEGLSFNTDGTQVLYYSVSGGTIHLFSLSVPYWTSGTVTSLGSISASTGTLEAEAAGGIVYSAPLAKWYKFGKANNSNGLVYEWNYNDIKIGVTTSTGALDYIRIN
jgi:hypothetical protein